MRVAVLGYAGSGKTYISDFISKRENIPCLHLDTIRYDNEWMPVDDSVVLPMVDAFMSKEAWVIDGLYMDLRIDERLEKADKIIILLPPRSLCLFRAIKRKKQRMQAGYKNDLNWWFIKFVLFGCRNKDKQRIYREIARKYEGKTMVLKSRQQVDRFMRSM